MLALSRLWVSQAVRIAGCKASLHWLAAKNVVSAGAGPRDESLLFSLPLLPPNPRPHKRGPLALSGREAAKADRVLRAPFVLTEAWFVRHNAALAALEACAAVTNLFGLEWHQVAAAMCPSSRAARPGALTGREFSQGCLRCPALGTLGFKVRVSNWF